MNLNDIIKEAPVEEVVPMGQPDDIAENPNDLEGTPGSDIKFNQDREPKLSDDSQRVAIKKFVNGDEQMAIDVERAFVYMDRDQSIPSNFASSLKTFIENALGSQISSSSDAERLKNLNTSLKGGDSGANVENVQEEITGQDRVAIKQIVPDNQKVNDIIRAMARIQQGKNPPTDTIPAINDLIQNSIGIQIQLGTAQTKRGQDMVKQQKRAGGLDKEEPKQGQGNVVPIGQPKQGQGNVVPMGDPAKLAAGYKNPADALNEGLGYAMPGEEDSERVTYSKTKKQGDSSVTVSANADSMDELHDILRLAGIDFEKSGEVDHTPDHKDHDDHEEPEMDHGEHDKDKVMVISPADASMSTDKEVLTNYLKDKLKKSLS